MKINEAVEGDCFDILPHIETESVDMILSDLPYGTTYCDFDTVLKRRGKYGKKSLILLENLWLEYERIIKPDGAIVLFGSQPFTTILISSNLNLYRYSWVWEKNKAANHVAVRFQPLKIHEDILVFSKAGVNTGSSVPIKYRPQGVTWDAKTKVRKTNMAKVGTFNYNSLRAGEYQVQGSGYPNSILRFSVPSGEDRFHPTQKPVDLCEYLIRSYTDVGDLVLDSFAGSFTTAIAAENSARNWVCIEKDSDYCFKGRERITKNRDRLSEDD